ncbi:DUF4126 domain-containing protein [Longispora albida]|uniref:DUF4126 domain-containing protein n=1 Tax=Longispora albida TaxID=203523 RepID=UPI0003828A6B|nr:DUF4126 domain-containing protein [Longispora albida]
MLEALTGTGLAASAGLNAYIPLLIVGLLGRYTDLITLPQTWTWLSNGWVLTILGILLAIEVVADKIPAVDSINDVVQTVVRPTSGGLAFGAASSSETVAVADPGSFFSGNQWVAVVSGIVISLVVHGIKALVRPMVNVVSLGFAAPVVSAAEDFTSVVMSFVAIIIPVLVLLCLAGLAFGAWWLLSRRRRRTPKGGRVLSPD